MRVKITPFERSFLRFSDRDEAAGAAIIVSIAESQNPGVLANRRTEWLLFQGRLGATAVRFEVWGLGANDGLHLQHLRNCGGSIGSTDRIVCLCAGVPANLCRPSICEISTWNLDGLEMGIFRQTHIFGKAFEVLTIGSFVYSRDFCFVIAQK